MKYWGGLNPVWILKIKLRIFMPLAVLKTKFRQPLISYKPNLPMKLKEEYKKLKMHWSQALISQY